MVSGFSFSRVARARSPFWLAVWGTRKGAPVLARSSNLHGQPPSFGSEGVGFQPIARSHHGTHTTKGKSALSLRTFYVVAHDVTLPNGGRLLDVPLSRQIQRASIARRVYRRIRRRNPGAVCVQVDQYLQGTRRPSHMRLVVDNTARGTS